ncbi:hypothetical protein ARHIZOSPH14_33750 [Agromyces rhizosphaerae]|uniref:Macro domain-containing protein n=1 Tax=Agromyces rhizosphaerae TaxID=88374 RepID=A0A9W6FT76_9MICO|nr:macro domain-containing protein [Agromyces rhizosphaerae]GLI29133.1 hypothetical protein ARHIZOSPH14_33750 [Agromyces rhizosphaerae]
MPTITSVHGDLTEQRVDAIVNTASRRMRGGGGLDGAIHRAGGPAVLRDCRERFPRGLAVGDAGWTTAGELPATWVIHTVAPKHRGRPEDRELLASCYRRALEVADELGARSVAFPIIGTGVRRWPTREAVGAAIEAISTSGSSVRDVRLVTFTDDAAHAEVQRRLGAATPLRILQGVRALHERGVHAARILPGVSPSGLHWRVAVTHADNFVTEPYGLRVRDHDRAIHYTSADGTGFAEGEVNLTSTPDDAADLMLRALPDLDAGVDDPTYVRWYADLLAEVERHDALPIAFADGFDDSDGWEIGWGSGRRYPHPPGPAR